MKPVNLLPIAEALFEGGIRILEITLNSESPFEVIEHLSVQMKDKICIGAGTVLDIQSADKAIDHGAQFIISPSLDVDLVGYLKKKNIVVIPGAFTATEIVTAYRAGADIVKVFPAMSASYIQNLRGPLSNIRLMPTGGINTQNIAAFQKAGAVAFGVGHALVETDQQISAEALKQLIKKAEGFVHALADHSD